MGARESVKAVADKLRRKNTGSFYGILMTSAFELGEIARIEIEIHKLSSPGSPQPRCPNWHNPSSPPHGPVTLP
jgi:hypothetical protein